ncbi:MAG: SDR family oxidoreductase [Pseudomonadales bacterium]|nr:SDR family oxidoreductase [Pseudomonadales bacterium]
MGKLSDRVAIVTGSGRGVGEATARLLAADGARVVVNDLDADVAEQSAVAIRDAGGQAIAIPGSVTDTEFPEQLIDGALSAYGGVDIIVNNAGYIWNGAMHNHSDEQFQAMLDVHITAPFRILRAWAPWLKRTAKEEATSGSTRCRKVVNISSVSGTQGSATQIAYSAGKAGVIGVTKTLAREWGRYNVTVNCVAFGPIDTRLTQRYEGEPPTIEVGGRSHKVGLSDTQIDVMQASSPLGRTGQPKDGAGAVYLFCIPESDFVTGEVLTCSGGL